MCSMSTLVNSGTMSVLKLMAMGDTSSTLSCDTARPVSRVRSPLVTARPHWRAGDPPLRVATRHRGYAHTVFTFFADAVADLIRSFIAEPARAETAPL
jgi:hypothetical protein